MSSSSLDEFAKFLVNKKLLSSEATVATLVSSEPTGEPVLRKIWEATDLSANGFADEVAHFYGMRRLSLPELVAAKALTDRFSARFLRETSIFPFRAEDGGLKLAAADPSDRAAARAAEIVLGGPVEVEVASFEDIAIILGERIGADEAASPDERRPSASADDDIESLRDLASGAPVVRAVNDLLERAVELRASDIHIEPFRNGLTVRMRVDGLLRTVPAPADALPQALLSRIKILAGLNIAERRLPQDGAARQRIARSDIDIRVATMPTQYGESAVLRLLPQDRGLLDVARLGLSAADEKILMRLLELPHGLLVVTGPTGSGKTTSLATMLSLLNQPSRKILTIEDPVEYELPGVNQSQVKAGIGLTFATAMRAFVRQDPDVIMVGEVRDSETANIAVHAALTGHLVLTTLHTESAAAAIPRLLDLGVEGFLLKSTLRAVIAQRLVRVLCERCKKKRILTQEALEADPRLSALGLRCDDAIYEPVGCERCGGFGYRGRNGIFEILELKGEAYELVGPHADAHSIDRAARRAGMTTMVEDAVAKCRSGVTSTAEVLRVTTIR
ncbi:type II secretion system protein E [Methylocella silvestris BL2]|uniref:Type II secretion system protein E n=1 Tax=Methylocella silvestris (strain DSM 15510 / CIP 108128 / LMG 27833 / NCIMB 13906 / BL2) TaxID=395965 RepID=B8ESJ0_METSB|nr:GspE/PulE family protein [Methylocella silvestris]ACK49880.1 type II secretion system protein E [Methylocella silvestris BL2]